MFLSMAKPFQAPPSDDIPSPDDLDIKFADAPFNESSSGDTILSQDGDRERYMYGYRIHRVSRLHKGRNLYHRNDQPHEKCIGYDV